MQTEVQNPIEILLVEDNEADVVLTQRAFCKGKITNNVQVAYDGKQALEMLRQEG
ncbi:MAG: CheY-like chemotaxis protein, partial [bacterium]